MLVQLCKMVQGINSYPKTKISIRNIFFRIIRILWNLSLSNLFQISSNKSNNN